MSMLRQCQVLKDATESNLGDGVALTKCPQKIDLTLLIEIGIFFLLLSIMCDGCACI